MWSRMNHPSWSPSENSLVWAARFLSFLLLSPKSAWQGLPLIKLPHLTPLWCLCLEGPRLRHLWCFSLPSLVPLNATPQSFPMDNDRSPEALSSTQWLVCSLYPFFVEYISYWILNYGYPCRCLNSSTRCWAPRSQWHQNLLVHYTTICQAMCFRFYRRCASI